MDGEAIDRIGSDIQAVVTGKRFYTLALTRAGCASQWSRTGRLERGERPSATNALGVTAKTRPPDVRSTTANVLKRLRIMFVGWTQVAASANVAQS